MRLFGLFAFSLKTSGFGRKCSLFEKMGHRLSSSLLKKIILIRKNGDKKPETGYICFYLEDHEKSYGVMSRVKNK
jgi:hypothetical protein